MRQALLVQTVNRRGKDEDSDPERYFGLTILDNLWRDPELREVPVVIMSSMNRAAIEHRFASQGAWAFVDKSDLNKAKIEGIVSGLRSASR